MFARAKCKMDLAAWLIGAAVVCAGIAGAGNVRAKPAPAAKSAPAKTVAPPVVPPAGAPAAKPDTAKVESVPQQSVRSENARGETAAKSSPDSNLTLKGGQPGTALGSMTVEEENRIQVEFQRPDLQIELDPRQAPGLTWGSPAEVLQRSMPDMVAPFLAISARARSPYAPHPWLAGFRTGNVVRFAPRMVEVDRWKLTVVDSRSKMVAEFTGEKKPPQEIFWDGRAKDGSPCLPGLTYSYVFEAYDRAGNVRRLAGEGFQIPPYRYATGNDLTFVLAARQLEPAARPAAALEGSPAEPKDPALLQEAASWLNLRTRPAGPVRILAVARSLPEADQLGQRISATLQPLIQGEASRLAVTTRVEPGAPEAGAVIITTAGAKDAPRIAAPAPAAAAPAAAAPAPKTQPATTPVKRAADSKTPLLPPPPVRR